MGFESQSEAEIRTLLRLTEQINMGITLEDALNHLFDSFRDVIPFDRISLATVENQGAIVRSYWVRTDYPGIKIDRGYAAKLNGSSLQRIILTNEPRIINDVEAYLSTHPRSESTRRILEEGVRSSLTCPLIAAGKPVGLLFFSSRKPHAYATAHVQLFEAIAGQVATILEKARLYDQLFELNDIKNKFMGIVAHDLKTPLGVIKSHLDLLDQGLLGEISPRQQESVSLMRDWCGRMLALISNLLSMTVVESGKLELHKTPTNINEFLKREHPFYKLLAQGKGISLDFIVPDDLPVVPIDQDRISQVLNNLLTNAIKFSHPHSGISLSAYVTETHLTIAVTDHGQGIPENEQAHLFEFFTRTSVRPTAGETSTGIGLATARTMVEAHGGTISVRSKVGDGSTFLFSLPLVKS